MNGPGQSKTRLLAIFVATLGGLTPCLVAQSALASMAPLIQTTSEHPYEINKRRTLLAQVAIEPRAQMTDVVVGSGAGSAHTGEVVGVEPAVVGTRTPASDEQRAAINKAIEFIEQEDYSSASRDLVNFLREHPLSEIADDGWFWLGEARYLDRAFLESLQIFQTLIEYFPRSGHAPMARLRMGMNHFELKQFPKAREHLTDLISDQPADDIKARAQAVIERMNEAGV